MAPTRFHALLCVSLALPSPTLAATTQGPARPQGTLVSWAATQTGAPPSGSDFVQVACGDHNAVALRADGTLAPWGNDSNGIVSNAPTDAGYVDISCGRTFAAARRADGRLVTWGSNVFNVIGGTPPVPGFLDVSAGGLHAVAIRSDGSLKAWGDDSSGQVSNAPSGNDFVEVSSWSDVSAAIRSDGSLVAWGNNSDGQVSGTPSGTGFVQVAIGEGHALARRADGSIVSWGSNLFDLVSDTPTGSGFTDIAAGALHSIAIDPNGQVPHGQVVVWGSATPVIPALPGYFQAAGGGGFSAAIANWDSPGGPYCTTYDWGEFCACGVAQGAPSGCPNSSGIGSTLTATGTANFSNDTLQFSVTGGPPSSLGLILRGTFPNVAVIGQGVRCVVSNTMRSQVQVLSGGSTTFTNFNGAPFGSVALNGAPTFFQFWYRDQQPGCAPPKGNFSNAWVVSYQP